VARRRRRGIPVPGDPSQVIYVWFDALANYITALDFTEVAHTVGANTMRLQHLEALRTIGTSNATKIVVPVELADILTGRRLGGE
jgi:methionyl-tRNA synthetase